MELSIFAEEVPPNTQKLTRFLDELYRSSSSVGKIEILVKTETQERHLRMRIWSKGKEQSLVIIDEPAREAGTATLKVGDNLWNYLPKISRTIRIPPSMMLSPWMGTDFTNDDLVKKSSFEHDFESQIEGPSEEPKGWKLVMNVKPGIVGRWQKIECLIDNEYLPHIARFYDRKGRLARTFEYSDFRVLGGRKIPTHIRLVSEDQPGHETELRYLEMVFDVNLPDSLFSLSQLERK